jgi:invasion protein IalB
MRQSPSPVFALAALLASTWSSFAQGIPGGATSLNEIHGDWTLSCTAPDGVAHCTISQLQLQGENRQRLLAMELTRARGDNGATGALVLPFGLRLSDGITLGLDHAAPFQRLHFTTCLPAGCLVPLAFDANLISAIGSSTALAIKATANDSGEEVALSVSMSGFTSALTRLTELTGS